MFKIPETTWGNLTIATDGSGNVTGTLSNVVGPAASAITATATNTGSNGPGVTLSGLPSADLTVFSLDYNATNSYAASNITVNSVSSTSLFIRSMNVNNTSNTLVFQTTSAS